MDLNFRKILQQAWGLTKAHRFLWAFGLFLIFGLAANIILGQDWGVIAPSIKTVNVSQESRWLISAAAVLILGFLYFRGKAGLIIALRDLSQRQPAGFLASWRQSRGVWARLAAIFLVVNLGLSVVVLAVDWPLEYISTRLPAGDAAVLSAAGLLILFPCSVVAAYLYILAPLFAVLFAQPARAAIYAAYDLWAVNLWLLVRFGLYMICTRLIGWLCSLLAAAPFVFLAILAYYKLSGAMSAALAAVAWASAVVVFISIAAAGAAFQQACWFLLFEQLTGPEKITEDKSVAVSEAASQ